MNTSSVSRKVDGQQDLILISRKEYEALLEFKRFKEFNLTVSQKKALTKAELNFKKGKTLTYHELVKKLGSSN